MGQGRQSDIPQEKILRAIGKVSPSANGFVIQLESRYAQGLIGLDDFSHALVLWWASEGDSDALRDTLIYQKPYTNNPADVGVFGSRSPSRPNPIGLSVIRVIQVDQVNACVTTPYIDAAPDTPIIDIKPYFPASDRVNSAEMPAWCAHWPQSVEESAEFDWAREFE